MSDIAWIAILACSILVAAVHTCKQGTCSSQCKDGRRTECNLINVDTQQAEDGSILTSGSVTCEINDRLSRYNIPINLYHFVEAMKYNITPPHVLHINITCIDESRFGFQNKKQINHTSIMIHVQIHHCVTSWTSIINLGNAFNLLELGLDAVTGLSSVEITSAQRYVPHGLESILNVTLMNIQGNFPLIFQDYIWPNLTYLQIYKSKPPTQSLRLSMPQLQSLTLNGVMYQDSSFPWSCQQQLLPAHVSQPDKTGHTAVYWNTTRRDITSPQFAVRTLQIMGCGLIQMSGLNGCLQILIISHNMLTTIDSEMLSNVRDLEVVNVSYNKIHTLSKRAFAGLSKLRVIILAHNRLKYISIDVFTGTSMEGWIFPTIVSLSYQRKYLEVCNFSRCLTPHTILSQVCHTTLKIFPNQMLKKFI